VRSSPWRVVLLLAFLVLGLLDLFSVVSHIGAQTRLPARARATFKAAVERSRAHMAGVLAPGGLGSLKRALEDAVDMGLASNAEALTLDQRMLHAVPGSSGVAHWPTAEEVTRLRTGEILVVGPFADAPSRVVAYVAHLAAGQPVVLRLSGSVPGLAEDLRERRELLIVHGLVLLVLLVAGWSVFFLPSRSETPPPPAALAAYEEAMERLRDRGEELHHQHQEERRHMEGRLQDHEAMARAGELTAGMVHEVRNGLGTIAGYARLLDRPAAGSAAPEAAARILEECAALETVIRRFMEFVKRDALVLAPCDLARLVERVTARECHAREGAAVHAPKALRDGEATVVGDEALLERVLENLIRNAREAAGPGGNVWIELARRGDTLATTISDDGPGLSAELRKTVRPFVTTKPGGLGLGLPLALKLVGLHGGTLVLGDRPPRGLRIEMTLPVGGPPG
jgi:signal transduction histidine kinase